MRDVDVIILSTGRAASTAVYQYLDKACELHLPKNKEPHYWCNVHQYGGLQRVLQDIYVGSLDEYIDLYCDSEIVVDASVGYFFCLDEVIERLRERRQAPKVVFLYREPVSRAISLFSEERKKGATNARDVLTDIARDRVPGLWWEHYYDNVLYADCFNKITSNFNEILAVNFDYFARNPRTTLQEICLFLGLDPINLNEVRFAPVNSSREADAVSRLRKLRKFGRFVPSFGKRLVVRLFERLGPRTASHVFRDLDQYLTTSIRQYETFREQIGFEDMMCIKK